MPRDGAPPETAVTIAGPASVTRAELPRGRTPSTPIGLDHPAGTARKRKRRRDAATRRSRRRLAIRAPTRTRPAARFIGPTQASTASPRRPTASDTSLIVPLHSIEQSPELLALLLREFRLLRHE